MKRLGEERPPAYGEIGTFFNNECRGPPGTAGEWPHTTSFSCVRCIGGREVRFWKVIIMGMCASGPRRTNGRLRR